MDAVKGERGMRRTALVWRIACRSDAAVFLDTLFSSDPDRTRATHHAAL